MAFEFDPDKLNQQADDVNSQKKWLGVAGDVANSLSSVQSPAEIRLGMARQQGTAGNVAKNLAANIEDPRERQAKLYALYKDAQNSRMADTQEKLQAGQEQDASEHRDANSQRSKNARDSYRRAFPKLAEQMGDGYESMSAADLEASLKPQEFADKIAATKEIAASRADANRQRMEDKRAQALSAQDNKDAMALSTELGKGWAARSGPAGATQSKILNAEAAEQLIEQGRHQKNGLDSRQIEELAQSTAKLLGGGASASARVEALVPHTFFGRAQSLKEWLTGNPQGAAQQEFVDRMAETVQREKALALQQKKQYQIEALPAHARLKQSNPELYRSILAGKQIDPDSIDERGLLRKEENQMAKGAPGKQGAPGGTPQPGMQKAEATKNYDHMTDAELDAELARSAK